MLRTVIVCLCLVLPAGHVFAARVTREKVGLAPPAGPSASGPVGEMQVRTSPKGTDLSFRFTGLGHYETYEVKGNDGKLALGQVTANAGGRARLRLRIPPGGPPHPDWLTGRGVVLSPWRAAEVLLVGLFPGERTTLGDEPPDPDPDPDPDPGPWPPPPPPPPPPDPDPPPETRLSGVDGDGPYPTAYATVSLPTVSGGLAPNSTVVYWPGDATGLHGTTERYPPVVIVHGFSLRASNYLVYAQKLASWGFVALVGDHQDPMFLADHEKELKTTQGYIDWLVAQDADPSSRFFGRLATTKFGLAGHSLGGGVAVVGSTRGATGGRVKACVGLAPAALAGSGGSAIGGDTTTGYWPPTLVITGSEDTIVTPSTSKTSHYVPAPSGKMFLRLDGHCHTNYSDTVLLAIDYNASTCVSGDEQRKKARLYLVSWFLYHLRGDKRVSDYVDGTYAAEDSSVEELARE